MTKKNVNEILTVEVTPDPNAHSDWWVLSVPSLMLTLRTKDLNQAERLVNEAVKSHLKTKPEMGENAFSEMHLVFSGNNPEKLEILEDKAPISVTSPRWAVEPPRETSGRPLLECENLTVTYAGGDVVAVDNLSLSVEGGTVLGLLGGNGAGKTSTLRTFGGVMPPSSGFLHVGGFSMTSAKEAELARRDLGYCPDTGGLVRQSTVREHVAVALALRKMENFWPEALDLVERFGLTSVLDRETGGFSHGMSRRLSVLLAVLTSRSVLILDEPFDGVDPLGVEATEESIKAATNAGLAVVVSTHLLSLLSRVSDRVCVMSGGKIVADEQAEVFKGEQGERYYDMLLRGSAKEVRM